jgi:5-methylcytosine-specific restriction endonuclease McrA
MGDIVLPSAQDNVGVISDEPRDDSGDEEGGSMAIGKIEWTALKKQYGNKCALCPTKEKHVGDLDKAHLKARSKGGSQIIPLCPNCHQRFDRGLLTRTEQKKLGFETEQEYKRVQPKPRRQTSDGW